MGNCGKIKVYAAPKGGKNQNEGMFFRQEKQRKNGKGKEKQKLARRAEGEEYGGANHQNAAYEQGVFP